MSAEGPYSLEAKHFFSNRQEGAIPTLSCSNAAWRLGTGNVFITSDPNEVENVIKNLEVIVGKHAPEAEHQVLLDSKYGKGIGVVDDDFLTNESLKRDQTGRIILEGDGLFTQKKNVLLLNKSGDAHAIIFESSTAIGIIVGSWMGISKGILSNMREHFLARGIDPKDITIQIGPGLGSTSYDMGKDVYEKVLAENPAFKDAFFIKQKKSQPDVSKYILNMAKLIEIANEGLEMKIDASRSDNTFEREKWHQIRQEILEKRDPNILMQYYGNSEQVPYFSARLYSRVSKYIKKIAGEEAWHSDAGSKSGTYGETGRCLNGVMLIQR